jgi:hypothetical protein
MAGDITTQRDAYLTSIESANRQADLSQGPIPPDAIEYSLASGRGNTKFYIDHAIEDTGVVVALKQPDIKGNNIAKRILDKETAGNLSSFITSSMQVPMKYMFFKLIIEEGQYDLEGEKSYLDIVDTLIGRADARSFAGHSLRRVYNTDPSKTPQTGTKRDVTTTKRSIEAELTNLEAEIETKLAGQTILTQEQQTALVEEATAKLRGGFTTQEGIKQFAINILLQAGLREDAMQISDATIETPMTLTGNMFDEEDMFDEIDSDELAKAMGINIKEYIERGENIKLTRGDLRQLISQGETIVNPYDGISDEDLAVKVIGMLKDHIKKLTSPKIIELLNNIIALPANVANESRIYENILKKILYTANKRQ